MWWLELDNGVINRSDGYLENGWVINRSEFSLVFVCWLT